MCVCVCVCVYVCVCVVWFSFYDIDGYLMPNPVFTYILYIRSINTFSWYTQLNKQTVLFTTIEFSVSQRS